MRADVRGSVLRELGRSRELAQLAYRPGPSHPDVGTLALAVLSLAQVVETLLAELAELEKKP